MQYKRISADCHLDMPWTPPTLFVENELAAGTLVAIGPPVESRSAYYFVYPQHKEEYYPLRRFADWLATEIRPPGDTPRNAAPSSPTAPA